MRKRVRPPGGALEGLDARVKKVGERIPRSVVSRLAEGARFYPPRGQVAFKDVTIVGADFHETRWDDFRASNSAFVGCDFRRARFGQAVFGSRTARQTSFRNCRFDGADLRNADPAEARFEGCVFDGAKIEEWRSFLAEFVDCRFAGRIVACIFSGRPWGPGADHLEPPRTTNEFRGNDFRDVDLIDCSFVRGIDIDTQLWPANDLYVRLDRAKKRIAEARTLISRWPDGPERLAALRMLDVYSSAGYEEQDQLFVRRDNLLTVRADIRDRVWNLLEHSGVSD